MYVNGEREVKVIAYALLISALVCLAGLLLSGGCGRSGSRAGDNGERATQQVKRAEDLNRQAGAEIDAAAGAAGRAEQHADRAERLNQAAQAGTDDGKKLVEQLKADNRRAKQLIDELISNAQARAAQDATH